MAPHSSTLAWKIPCTVEPGRLQSMGSLRVRHDWTSSLSLFTFHFQALEKEMATRSSVLAWRIPGTGEPGGLPSVGSHRVGHDWSDLAAAAAGVKSLTIRVYEIRKTAVIDSLEKENLSNKIIIMEWKKWKETGWYNHSSCLAFPAPFPHLLKLISSFAFTC